MKNGTKKDMKKGYIPQCGIYPFVASHRRNRKNIQNGLGVEHF